MSTVHDGHRSRMRERYRHEGLDGFAPHEVLELLLFYGRARGDTNALAHSLLDCFGSLKGVLEATPEQLMTVKGIGEESATLLSLMLPMFRRYSACLIEKTKYLKTKTEALDYCLALLSGERQQKFYTISLSPDGKLLGRKLISTGISGQVAIHSRLIVEAALYHNAAAIVLCHNHPSGNPAPSPEDLYVTDLLKKLLSSLDIVLLDHIIVAGNATYSMSQHGELHE